MDRTIFFGIVVATFASTKAVSVPPSEGWTFVSASADKSQIYAVDPPTVSQRNGAMLFWDLAIYKQTRTISGVRAGSPLTAKAVDCSAGRIYHIHQTHSVLTAAAPTEHTELLGTRGMAIFPDTVGEQVARYVCGQRANEAFVTTPATSRELASQARTGCDAIIAFMQL